MNQSSSMDLKNRVLEDILDRVLEAGADRDRLEQRVTDVLKDMKDAVPDSQLYHGLHSHSIMLHDDAVCATQRLSRWLSALEKVLSAASETSIRD